MHFLKSRPVVLDVRPLGLALEAERVRRSCHLPLIQGWKPPEKMKELKRRQQQEEASNTRVLSRLSRALPSADLEAEQKAKMAVEKKRREQAPVADEGRAARFGVRTACSHTGPGLWSRSDAVG